MKIHRLVNHILYILNTNTKTQVDREFSKYQRIQIRSGKNHLVMGKIIKSIQKIIKIIKEYSLGEHHVKVACYGDDNVLIAEPEHNLQQLFYINSLYKII